MRQTRRGGLRHVAALAAVAALGGCADDARRARPPAPDLPRAVLGPADVGRPFRAVEVGRQLRSEQPLGERSDPARFGRRDGWKARFARAGSTTTAGPLVVESRVDAFADADGARRELAAHRRQAVRPTGEGGFGGRLVAAGVVGDEAFAYEVRQAGLTAVRHVTVAWRSGALTGTLTANGFRDVGPATTALARRQQARMSAAVRRRAARTPGG